MHQCPGGHDEDTAFLLLQAVQDRQSLGDEFRQWREDIVGKRLPVGEGLDRDAGVLEKETGLEFQLVRLLDVRCDDKESASAVRCPGLRQAQPVPRPSPAG